MIINNTNNLLRTPSLSRHALLAPAPSSDPEEETRRLISSACPAILKICNNSSCDATTSEKDLQQLDQSLATIFKLLVTSKNTHSQLLTFFLSRVPWFECPLLTTRLHFLEKFAKWYRTQGKQANTVIYNLLAGGLMFAHCRQQVIDVLCRLMDGRYDSELLLNCLRESYPYKYRDLDSHQNYLKGLLTLAEARPVLRGAILETIVDKLSTIDTEIKLGDEYLTQPYLKETSILLQRATTTPTLNNDSDERLDQKLDDLLDTLISYLGDMEFTDDLSQEMLMIFHNKVLITEKNKFIQYIFYCLAEKDKRVAGFFLSMLLNTVLQVSPSNYKSAYLNNLHYLAAYCLRSTATPEKRIVKTMQEVLRHLNKSISKKVDVDLHGVNLQQVFQENEIPLYLVQFVLYVCTYKPQLYFTLQAQIQATLLKANHKCLYESFINIEILNRFKVYCQHKEPLSLCQERHYMTFENKFNPVLLPKLAARVDPIFSFYKYIEFPPVEVKADNNQQQNQRHIRKSSCEELQFIVKPVKKVKMTSEKYSNFSDDSTVHHSIRGQF